MFKKIIYLKIHNINKKNSEYFFTKVMTENRIESIKKQIASQKKQYTEHLKLKVLFEILRK